VALIPKDVKNRVYVLGSGFSASMGLPTLNNLFKAIMEFPEREGESDKDNVYTALVYLYPYFNKAFSTPSYPPFEEFLSLALAAEDFSFFYPTDFWEAKNRSALRLLTDFIGDKSKEAEKSKLLRAFTSKLQNGDVIITFNWDSLIERALLSQRRKINLHKRDNQAITVLKMHGSLSWVDIPEQFRLKHPESVIELSERIYRTKDHTYYDIWDALDLPPLIIPPGLSKRVIVNTFFNNIWSEAYQAIATADSLTVIGYSIPKDDVQARSLLTIGWLSRFKYPMKERIKYILIDPDMRIGGRYAALLSNELTYIQCYFDEKVLAMLFDD
jgi:NAD-dependent SIR2 family protein deacetylase